MHGCAVCTGPSAAAAWEQRGAHPLVAAVAEEAHFSVRVVRCAACGQAFASVFCESINWSGGDDSQASLLVPITADEATGLIAAGPDDVERAVRALSPARPHLVRSSPRDPQLPAVAWSNGPIWLPRHD